MSEKKYSMKPQYAEWIKKHNLEKIENSLGNCEKYARMMAADFPEMRLAKGIVYSHENPDNFHPNHPIEYPHWWLFDDNGWIVDPTRSQFKLIGDIVYKEFDQDKPISKCIGCGTYIQSNRRRCGRCPWTMEV